MTSAPRSRLKHSIGESARKHLKVGRRLPSILRGVVRRTEKSMDKRVASGEDERVNPMESQHDQRPPGMALSQMAICLGLLLTGCVMAPPPAPPVWFIDRAGQVQSTCSYEEAFRGFHQAGFPKDQWRVRGEPCGGGSCAA